jgi:hypothetical protein
MSRRFETVPSIVTSQAVIRAPRTNKPQAISAAEREVRRQRNCDRGDQVRARLDSFWAYAKDYALSLSEEFGFSARHAMDLLFCEGNRMIHARETTNAYNAFMSLKFEEVKNSMLFRFLFYCGLWYALQVGILKTSTMYPLLSSRRSIFKNITDSPKRRRRKS